MNCLPARSVDVDLSTDAGQAPRAGPWPDRPLADVVTEVFGPCSWTLTGSGRGAESVVASLVGPGSLVLANEIYLSGQWWIERFGGTIGPFPPSRDIDAARRPGDPPPPAMLVITAPRARLGPALGRGVALPQLVAARAWLEQHAPESPLVLDASRVVENAAATGATVAQLVADADIVVISARKDAGCCAGGLVVARGATWWPRLNAAADVLEGAGGGLRADEVAAFARGFDRAVHGTSVAERLVAVTALANRLRAQGLRVVSTGAGSIVLAAPDWVPEVPPDQLQAQVLLNVIYLLTGIRGLGTPAEEPGSPQVVRLAVRDAAHLIEHSAGAIAAMGATLTSGLRVTEWRGHPPFRRPAEPVDVGEWPAPADAVPRRTGSSGWLIARTHGGRGPQRALVEGWGRAWPGSALETDDVVLNDLHRLLGGSPTADAGSTIRAARLSRLRDLSAPRPPGDILVVDIESPGRWPGVEPSARGVDALWAAGDDGGFLALPTTSTLAAAVAEGALFTAGAWLDPWNREEGP